MTWISARAADYVGLGLFRQITQGDLAPELREPVGRGWMVSDEAVLLSAWHESYFGERSRFSDIIDYEAAVNGRGIPAMDMVEVGVARVAPLLRRGVAFAWSALYRQYGQLPGIELTAYVTAAGTLMDPDYFTGNVTFCTNRPDRRPYIDPMCSMDEIVVSLTTEDCKRPLPAVSQ